MSESRCRRCRGCTLVSRPCPPDTIQLGIRHTMWRQQVPSMALGSRVVVVEEEQEVPLELCIHSRPTLSRC